MSDGPKPPGHLGHTRRHLIVKGDVGSHGFDYNLAQDDWMTAQKGVMKLQRNILTES